MELQWEGVQGGVQKCMHKRGLQGGFAKPWCKRGVQSGALQWERLLGSDAAWNCNRKGCEEGCKSGCTKEGCKGGLQSGGANAGCTEGLCNAGKCNLGM